MSGRHQPTNGADSPQALVGYVNPDASGDGNWSEEYVLRPFVVVMEDYDQDRITVRISAAIGPRDAENQARDLRPGYMVLGVKEAA